MLSTMKLDYICRYKNFKALYTVKLRVDKLYRDLLEMQISFLRLNFSYKCSQAYKDICNGKRNCIDHGITQPSATKHFINNLHWNGS